MPMTDAYEQNDYQGYNTRPAELPLNDMFKAVQAQNDYWNMGALKVKGAYDNALGLNLTLDANKDVKNSYLLKAQDQIKQLSSMDMGDYNVQQQGMNLFTPLMSDKAIQYDNAISNLRDSIYNDASSYKNQLMQKGDPKGDGYSDNNLKFALQGFTDFNSKLPRDPDKLEALYKSVKNSSYTPYYNPAQENDKIMKDCGKASLSTQSVDPHNGMYFDSYSRSGADPQQVTNCLQTGLSDRAKNQIFIDSWAKYQNDPSLLAEDVINKYKPIVNSYNQQIASNKGAMDALMGKPNKTDEELQKLQNYDFMIQAAKAKQSSLDMALDAKSKGNYKYFKDNYNNIANQLGYEDYISRASQALRTDNIVDKKIENPVGTFIEGWNKKFLLSDHEFEHQTALEQMKARNNLLIEEMKLAGSINGKSGGSDFDFTIGPDGNLMKTLKVPIPTTPGSNPEDVQSPTEYKDAMGKTNDIVRDVYTQFNNLSSIIDAATTGAIGVKSLGSTNPLIKGGNKGAMIPITANGGLQDFNGDGKIDMNDFTDWRNSFVKQLNISGIDWKDPKTTLAVRKAAEALDKWTLETIPKIRQLYAQKFYNDGLENSIDGGKEGANINGVHITTKMLADAKNGISTNPDLNYREYNYNPQFQYAGSDGLVAGGEPIGSRQPVFLLKGVPINDALQKSGLLDKTEDYDKRRNDLFFKQRLNTNQAIAPGSYPASEKKFTDAVEKATQGVGNYKVVLNDYDGIKGGGVTFKLLGKAAKKNDTTDGSDDGYVDVPYSDDIFQGFSNLFGKTSIHRVGNTDFYRVENHQLVDRFLGQYNDKISKDIEQDINGAIYVQNVAHGYEKNDDKKKPVIGWINGGSMFGNTNSTPLNFVTSTGGVANVDVVKMSNANGGYDNVFDVRTAPNSLANFNGSATRFTDIKSLIDNLVKNLGVK